MPKNVIVAIWFILALTTLMLLLLEGDWYTVVVALVAWTGGLVTKQMWEAREKHGA